jgi:antitoxin YefM
MQIVSYTHARQNLAAVMQKAHDDQDAIIITRNGHEPVAVLPLDMLQSWQETAYQYASPENAAQLKESIRKAEAREGITSFDATEFFARAARDEG